MWKQGRHADALPFQERALDTAKGCVGADHPALVRLLNNLAVTYSETRRTAEADAAFLRAISIAEKSLGPAQAVYGKVLANYAVFLRQAQRKSEAKRTAAR